LGSVNLEDRVKDGGEWNWLRIAFEWRVVVLAALNFCNLLGQC